MSHTFGKITIASGQRIFEDVGGTGLSGVMIGNESGLTCEITMVGANVKRTLYPGTVDFFEVPQGRTWNGNLQIDPTADLSNFSSYPGSYVRIDTFGPGERPAGQYPMALPRLSNVGNTVNTNVAGTNSVSNDGNPAGTVFVEATQSGNGVGSNVVMQNSGDVAFKQFVSNVLTTLFQTISNQSGNNSSVKIGNTSLQTEIIGNLLADARVILQNNQGLYSKDTNGVAQQIFLLDSGNTTNVFAGGSSPQIIFRDINAAALAQITNSMFEIIIHNGLLNIRDSSGNTGTVLTIDNSGNTILKAHPTNNQVVIWDKNGNILSTIDANGCINMSGAIQTVNGDTSGTMTVQEIFAGGSKWVIIKQNNYKQAGAAQTIALKNTFTGPFFIANMGCGGIQFVSGGVVQNGNYLATISATGGTFTAENAAAQCTIGWNNTACDTVQSQGGYASAHTGVCIMSGY